jgi:O-antigen ligase
MNTLTDQAACNPESGAASKIRAWSARATGWALVALGVAIPLSTSAASIVLGLILLLWIVGGDYRAKWEIMRRHPLAVASLILFGLYVLGLFHGKPGIRVAFDVTHFLLLAVCITLFREESVRRFALMGFLAAVIVMMALSYLSWFSLLPPIDLLRMETGSPLVIHHRITYAFFVMFAAFIFAVYALFAPSRPARLIWALLAITATINIYMANNKTAFVILPVLAGYLLIRQWRWKGTAVFIMIASLLAVITYNLPTSALHQRVAGAIQQLRQWQPDKADYSSVGQRLEFYFYSLKIVRDYPLLGVGVGDFADAYKSRAKDPKMDLSDNPHNEYMQVATQLGLIGLAALLYLFYTQWRLAPRLQTPIDTILARGVVLAFVVGCLFNSFLTDYHEGIFFIWISALLFSGLKPLRKNDNVSP